MYKFFNNGDVHLNGQYIGRIDSEGEGRFENTIDEEVVKKACRKAIREAKGEKFVQWEPAPEIVRFAYGGWPESGFTKKTCDKPQILTAEKE